MSENVPDELVEQVVEITACPEDEAKHLLAACANNVEAAVALFFEQGTGASASDTGATTSAAAALAAAAGCSTPPVQLIDDDDGDGVRAPIAPIREQLIMPEDDNFYVAAPPPSRIARPAQRVKICPLRDFAREAALMEEQLLATGERIMANHLTEELGMLPSSFGSRRAANMVNAAQAAPKHSRLVDLFRPPTDLIYAGTFHIARKHATNLKQWLLVNLQSDNFDSQLLNRDVWSDKKLRKLVRRQFVLWQVDADSNEGRRFAAFYKCNKLPYVCVIDPRTGEEVLKIVEPKQTNVMPDLQQFLVEHKDFALEDAPSTSKRSMPIIVDDDDDEEGDGDADKANGKGFAAQSSSGEGSTKKRAKLLELSEEEQIAMAIRNSMRENGGAKNGNGKNKAKDTDDEDDDDDDEDAASDFGSIEEFTDDDTKTASELMSYEQLLGSAKDEITMLKVRLLNAEGAEEIVQLKWPSDTTCKALRAYIAQVHSHIPKKDKNYKIISAFPRKTLEESHNDATLKELGLHPSANLHVTLD